MSDFIYWYTVGVVACVPFAFYYIGVYFSETGRRLGVGERLFAVIFYLLLCVLSWVLLALDVLVFLSDLLVGHKMIRRRQ